MDVGGVDEGNAEAMDCDQLLRQLQERSDMALRRIRDKHGVQLPARNLGLHLDRASLD